MPRVMIDGWKCCRCGYDWVSQEMPNKPITCPNPKCRSPYWDIPKKNTSTKYCTKCGHTFESDKSLHEVVICPNCHTT